MNICRSVALTALLSTVAFFSQTAEARLYTARLMAADEEILPASQRDSIDSKAADNNNELSFESATRLSELAELYRGRGLYSDAQAILQDLVAMRQRTVGAETPEIAGYLVSLADVYLAKKEYAQAEPLYLRSLAIREKSLGLNHPDVAESLRRLADLYREQTRYEEAQPLYARALAILEEVYGPEHPEVAAVRASYTALVAASVRAAVKVR